VTDGAETVSWIELGVIAKPHGVTGELRVHVFNSESTLLRELAEVFLIGEEGEEPALVEVESTRQGPKVLLMRLAGVGSREDADALRGYGPDRPACPRR
jgi:16S rRNA processing protein RimM